MVSTRSSSSSTSSSKTRRRRRRDEENWETIYGGLNQLLRKQQSQIESLLQHQHFLTQRLLLQHHSSHSHLSLLHLHISQLRRQLDLSNLSNSFDITKSNFIAASSHKNAFLYKHQLEDTRRELDDFKAWFDILSHTCPDQQVISPDWLYEALRAKGDNCGSPRDASQHCKLLEKEVASLKREYDKLSVNNTSQVASLRAEIKFAWNQYNEKEINLTNQLQAKSEELNKANEKIMTLVCGMEKLQSSNTGKDMILSTLRDNIKRLEDEARQKDEMITTCSKELEMLKSKRPIGIPTLMRCSAETLPSRSKRSRISRDEESPNTEKGSPSAQLEAANATLRTQVNKLEVQANLKTEEIARLSKELNLLRSNTAGDTPVLSRCPSKPSSSRLRNQGNRRSARSVVPKEESSYDDRVSKKGGKHGKGKQEVRSVEETPRLFTSQFKVPQLKKS